VTTINFIADTITKNTLKNLIVVRMIDKIQAKINPATIIIKVHVKTNHCYSDKFFQIFFCNYIRYNIIRLVNALPDLQYGYTC
jgi:hypothetical protein